MPSEVLLSTLNEKTNVSAFTELQTTQVSILSPEIYESSKLISRVQCSFSFSGSFIPDYCDSEFVRASNMVIVTNGNFSNVGQKRAIKVNSPVNVMNTDGEIILCLIINEFGVNYFIPHDSNKIRSSAEPKEVSLKHFFNKIAVTIHVWSVWR